jgi:hypothetical protein
MSTALQSPKTQISCTLLSFCFQISGDVYDKLVQDFIRSMRYPTLLPLETLNLEGEIQQIFVMLWWICVWRLSCSISFASRYLTC